MVNILAKEYFSAIIDGTSVLVVVGSEYIRPHLEYSMMIIAYN